MLRTTSQLQMCVAGRPTPCAWIQRGVCHWTTQLILERFNSPESWQDAILESKNLSKQDLHCDTHGWKCAQILGCSANTEWLSKHCWMEIVHVGITDENTCLDVESQQHKWHKSRPNAKQLLQPSSKNILLLLCCSTGGHCSSCFRGRLLASWERSFCRHVFLLAAMLLV